MKALSRSLLSLTLIASVFTSIGCDWDLEPEGSVPAGASAKQNAPTFSDGQETASNKAIPATAALKEITVAFKLDPRLTKSLYMGERWVSPPVFTSTLQKGKELSVEARAQGFDAGGRPLALSLQWISADPEMVTVRPAQGNKVNITVMRAGQTSLQVGSSGLSKTLTLKVRAKGNAIQVEISQ